VVFASFAQKPVDALVVGGSALTNSRRVQIATLAAYHRVPAIYSLREFVEVGGLIPATANRPCVTQSYCWACCRSVSTVPW
jgi:hypothetical protein